MHLPDQVKAGRHTLQRTQNHGNGNDHNDHTTSSKHRLPKSSHVWSCSEPVTSVAYSAPRVYAGTVTGKIHVYDLRTYQHVLEFDGHSGSILTMMAQDSGGDSYLFTGSSDSLIKVWLLPKTDTDEQRPLLSYTIYCFSDVGDIFSMGFMDGTLYLGTQNASVHWVELGSRAESDDVPAPSISLPARHPATRPNRFFDSAGPGGRLAPQQHETRKLLSGDLLKGEGSLVEVPPENQVAFAHESAVYAMVVDVARKRIVTGSGDGTIKIWRTDKYGGLHEESMIHTGDAVLDMALASSWQLCCGLDAGVVFVVDLDTLQVLRHELPTDEGSVNDGPLLALASVEDGLFVNRGSELIAFDASTSALQTWRAPGLVTAAITLQRLPPASDALAIRLGKPMGSPVGNLITTSKDGSIVLWNVPIGEEYTPTPEPEDREHTEPEYCDPLSNDEMIAVLSWLVQHQTVSGRDRKHWSECRHCATALRDMLRLMGANSELLRVENGNPVVWAAFHANADPAPKEKARVLFYGHYDVIEAVNSAAWNTPPFQLTSVDGYMYGRGVTDNKGPSVAAMFAVAGLYADHKLPNDVIFLLEGEEESGSFGFQSTIEKHLGRVGPIDWIVFSNSYWLNDTRPCLNYGLRGVIFAEIEITSGKGDLHSGVDGGLYREPAQDMIKLLTTLTTPTGEIAIPKFFDAVLPVTPQEQKLYEDITEANPSTSINDLMHKWRFPSLTVHKFEVSGPGNQTVIPASVRAFISLRLVPCQTAAEIKRRTRDYLEKQFALLQSTNHLELRYKYDADPWLGDPSNDAFQILSKALEDEWGIPPLFIREGGSVPVARALEKMFDAPAVQLPCGQSTDGAHLNNERLRITNLLNTRKVFERTFSELSRRPNRVQDDVQNRETMETIQDSELN